MADSEPLARLDVFPALGAIAVVVYLDVLPESLVVGAVAVAVVAVGPYAVRSYASAYLFAAGDTGD